MAEFSAYIRNEGIRENGVVVDIGGSTGNAVIAITEAFPHFKLVVQDLPANADNRRKMLDSSPDKASLAARITF
ncbi:hypothetical protein DL771_008895 [Monosporascus sp. 5C6A]|nr:hypothetical protein DL771_008895 [Monosporascus sp. 5C6A]